MDWQSGETKEAGDQAGARSPRLTWYKSIYGKVSLFLFASIVLAYGLGASTGWIMAEKRLDESWGRQAMLNAQVTSFAIRNIYTFVSVQSDELGQVNRIVSDRAIGDDDSVLDTGFNPVDVMALAAAQTKNKVWLFSYDPQQNRYLSVADSTGSDRGEPLSLPPGIPYGAFHVGLASIGKTEHFAAVLPVVSSAGQPLGAVVASIGRADELYASRNRIAINSAVLLLAVLLVAGVVVQLTMRRLFSPVPLLVRALTRLARDDTTMVTPFQSRTDEVGHLANAIETLREAVVERENLRQMREVARQMEHLAHHDSLTGLPNRALFNARLEDALGRMRADGGRFNVLLIDLDRFKVVNDTLGHPIGDELLVAVTQRLTMLLDGPDVAARLGGDEFAILQRVKKNAILEASRLSGAIVQAVAEPFELSGHQVSIGASIGAACAPLHGDEASLLLKNADIALYRSKATGRGNFHIFRDGMVMAEIDRYALVRDLESAIENGELVLHFQPIHHLATGRRSGYEALLRWNHPSLGLLAPDRFIHFAEESGLIREIGAWVIDKACEAAAGFDEPLTIAVNISPLQLDGRRIVDTVKAALSRHKLPAERLELELTESVALCDEAGFELLHDLSTLGVAIALDDFGTGYSSLQYLMRLPVSKIKIDRSFVHALAESGNSGTLVTAIVAMARNLSITTVAEGIEDETQAGLLRLAGCDLGQGYFFGRPAALPQTSAARQSIAG